MLKKLLKYDLKFIFKYWWIAALVCIMLSFISGFCITLLESERELPSVVDASASAIVFLSIFVFFAFAVVPTILIFIRFYSNFFSDEGYLTFTLPIKRNTLLNSKIISALIIQIVTSFAISVCILFMLMIGFGGDFFSAEIWKEIGKGLKLYFATNTICRIIYIIEAILVFIISTIFSDLFLFTCITYASIITKKARVITAIGIYYGTNLMISFTIQVFAVFGISTIAKYFTQLSESVLEPTICLAGFGVIVFFIAICTALYTLLYRMLDRKLNLT